MKIGYTGKADFTSKGVTFKAGETKEVKKEFGDYLVDTFDGLFVAIVPEPAKKPAKDS